MAVYLPFEEPIKELEEQLEKNIKLQKEKGVDTTEIILQIEKKIDETRKQIYSNLTPWQRVLVSRHPERPYTLSYIEYLTKGNFIELHGDRGVKDDKAMVGGIGEIEKPLRGPMTMAATIAATPAVICTTVPPAKS